MTRLMQPQARAPVAALSAGGSAVGHWTPVRMGAALALVAVAVFVARDAWADLTSWAWRDEEQSHILLVPLIVGWLVWARRDRAAAIRPESSLVGPAIIALGGLINWYGFNFLTQSAWHFGAVLMAVGAFLTVSGWRLAWSLLPAFVVLAFLVPVPGTIRQQIAIPLQEAAAHATEWIYHLFALDIVRNGNVLHFNGQDIAVAEACNGMRMVFALILVTYAVAFAQPLRTYVRVLLLAASPLLALVCNIIRLLPTVWLYGYYPETLGPIFHDLSGWAMILVAFGLVMGIIRLLQWLELPIMREGEDGAAEPAEATR
jgi:exosortase